MKPFYLIAVLFALVTGCATARPATPKFYDIVCVTMGGPFTMRGIPASKLLGSEDPYAVTYTIALPTGEQMTLAKANCIVGSAPEVVHLGTDGE